MNYTVKQTIEKFHVIFIDMKMLWIIWTIKHNNENAMKMK